MRGDRILIVDDEADISLILKLQLEDAGYRTVRAHDGLEALECLAKQCFDLMLLDIKMPRLNGLQVLERSQHEFPDVAVVMMTAHGNELIAVDAMKKGAIDYIAKPFSSDDAVKKVERAISFNRARLENCRLNKELAREQQKVSAILEGMEDLLIAVDTEGRVMTVNRRVEEELGLSRGDLIGKAVSEVIRANIPPEQLPCMVALKSAEPCRDITYTLNLPGRSLPVLSNASPLRESSGLIGSVEIIRDISTLKALEQEKEDFVSMLSHDLKSPITAIVGSLDLVHDGLLGKVNADQKEYLESAVESCAEMVEMIDTLLDVHKFEAGKMNMAFKLDDPGSLLQKILNRYQPVANRAQLELTLKMAENLPDVSFDRAKITRVLGNLLTNAFKFTAEGGKVIISVEMIDNPATVISRIGKGLYPESSLPHEGRYLMVSVIDNGVGIPADSLENIFDRFAQARNRRLGKTRGTGLGLAFCRKVIDAHHGFIWAESMEGYGSTFSVLLPLAAVKRETPK